MIIRLLSGILFLILLCDDYALNLPITVKESAGVAKDKFPVSAIVPLPCGLYQDSHAFQLFDNKGNTVRSQFQVLNRHWAKDGSVRHLQVDFLSSLEANGNTTYYLRDDGSGNSCAGELVNSDNDSITINTGVISLRIDKKNFNLFDLVKREGSTILDSSNEDGGIWHDRFGAIQYMAQQPNPEIIIEETGPVRVVLRIEQPSYFRPDGKYADLTPGLDNLTESLAEGDYVHRLGYRARIYAWEGLDYVLVEYSLINGDKTVLQAWPFYFRDFSLAFNLHSSWQSLEFGDSQGSQIYKRETGKYLYQKLHNQYEIKNSTGQSLFNGTQAEGWVNVSNGSNAGMMVAVKDFWQRWPNGFELDGNSRFFYHFFPPHGQDYFFDTSLSKMRETTAGLYWLDDMQIVNKTLLFYFHDGNKTTTDFRNLNKLLQKRPVPVLPTEWYAQTAVTLDMGGLFPVEQTIASLADTKDTNIDIWPNHDNIDHGLYGYGYDTYRADVGRRAAWTTGSWPRSAANFPLSANPKYFYNWEAMVTGDMNARPQYLPGFKYPDDKIEGYSPITEHPYTTYSWRYWKFNHGHPKIFATYLEGTDYSGFSPRDTSHMWNYYIEEYYYFSGDKQIYDWYRFMGNFCLANIYGDKNYPGVLADSSERAQLRGVGHLLSTLMQAYRITGEAEFLSGARDFLDRISQNQCKYGFIGSVAYMASAFQLAYLLRGIISLVEEIGDTESDFFAKALGVIEGFVAWNYHYGGFEYYIDNDLMINYYKGKIQSDETAFIIIDPICWYYHQTGEKKYIDHVQQYMDGELGKPPIQPLPGSLTDWHGDFAGRWSHYIFSSEYQRSAVTPSAITDLQAEKTGENIRLSWTAPAGANRFHVRWSDRPISSFQTTADAFCNWWQAELIANKAMEGNVQQLSFDLKKAPLNGILYFAVKSFNEHSNISPLSNVATLTVGDGDLVFPERVSDLRFKSGTEDTATLEWTVPGDDNNSGTASAYQFRLSNHSLTADNWSQAQLVTAPLPARNVEPSYHKTQVMTISALEMGIPYYVAMKSEDDAGNLSELSNVLYFMLREADKIPPAAIDNLQVKSSGLFGVELEWTAPGDDGSIGQASVYDIRFTSDSFDWQTAIAATEVPEPAPADSTENFIVKKLLSSTEYYFAIKTADAAGNWSNPSNVVSFPGCIIDQAPPAAVIDLRSVNVSDTFAELSWTATGDDGSVGTALRYEMAIANSPIGLEHWSKARKEEELPLPEEPGTLQTVRVDNLSRSTKYYFVLRVVDQALNYSDLSNQVQLTTEDAPSIASGKPVRSNNDYHGNLLSNLVDGTNEPWVSALEPNGIWAEVDLESFYRLSGADMIHVYKWDAYGHAIEVSADQFNWRRVGTFLSGQQNDRASHAFTADYVRYVRLIIEDQAYKHRVYISELKIYGEPSPADNVLIMQKGWNLISPPITLSENPVWPSEVQECYYYKDNQWLSGSREPSEDEEQANLPLNNLPLESGRGYFCYNNSGVTVTLTNEQTELDVNSLNEGWHLLSGYKIMPEFLKENQPIKIVWLYENGRWYYYARDFLDDRRLKIAGYQEIIYIPPTAGFWAKIEPD